MSKETVTGIKCLVCSDEIWSRNVHDFRWCKCHSVAIDGGRHYLKVTGSTENFKVIEIEIKTDIQKK